MSRKILEEMLGESNFPRKGRQPEQQQITLSLNDITVSFKFDDTGRLLSETIPKGSRLDRDYETVFSYDAKGNLSQIRYGKSGREVSVTNLTYHPNGVVKCHDNVTQESGGNTATRLDTYDDRGRMLTHRIGGEVHGTNYSELLTIAEKQAREKGRFRYVGLNRLPDAKVDPSEVRPTRNDRWAWSEYTYDDDAGTVTIKSWTNFTPNDQSKPCFEIIPQLDPNPKTSELRLRGIYSQAIGLLNQEPQKK